MNLGLDPEVGAFNKNGMVKPACIFMPEKEASKWEQANSYPDFHVRAYHDSCAIEWQQTPAMCIAYVLDCYRKGLLIADREGQKNGLTIRPAAGGKVGHVYLRLAPRYPQIMESGCNPVFNAFTGTFDRVADYASVVVNKGVFFGTHIHFERMNILEDLGMETIRLMVRFLAKTAGVLMRAISKDEWTGPRYSVYAPGRFRIKPYGIEWCDLDAGVGISPMHLAAALLMGRYVIGARLDSQFEIMRKLDADIPDDVMHAALTSPGNGLAMELSHKVADASLSAAVGPDGYFAADHPMRTSEALPLKGDTLRKRFFALSNYDGDWRHHWALHKKNVTHCLGFESGTRYLVGAGVSNWELYKCE